MKLSSSLVDVKRGAYKTKCSGERSSWKNGGERDLPDAEPYDDDDVVHHFQTGSIALLYLYRGLACLNTEYCSGERK